MKRILVPALLFSGWMALLTIDIPAKGSFLPALGRFLSPFHGIWQSVEPSLSSYDFKGQIKSNVRILFDDRDVPHIYADNLEDALYAQGYLHAANRLFAMDITARATSGRLSELIGQRTIAIDRKQRERGYEKSAIEKAKIWETPEGNNTLIAAYVNGVNDYISTLDYSQWPMEYKVLSHEPAQWSFVQSSLILTSMATALSLGEDDLEYSIAHAKLSPEDYTFLFPDHNPKESPVIPVENKWDFIPVQSSLHEGNAPHPATQGNTDDTRKRDLNGSNNWAVSGSKTAHGFPILANDPHLGLTLPNIWYEMEIHTPEMDVHGVSIPGLPFIVIGFNESIAWGSTNSGQDVLDWYQIKWQDSTRLQYKLDGQFVDATLRLEEIKIRGAKSIIDTIRYTKWGPVTHLDEHKDMAMKWIGHQKTITNDASYLEKINKAKNLEDYRDAVSAFQYPAQNKVFASTQGDIAISVAGKIPIRPEGQGETLTNGDDSRRDWQGYIPFEQAPYVINPSRGFVSSANQAPADTSYPYPLIGKRIFEDYRGRTLNNLLDRSNGVTPEDMKALQQNNYNLFAAEMLPILLKALDSSQCQSDDEKAVALKLSKWNFECDKDSLSPVYFELWFQAFDTMTWDELDNLGVMRPEEWRIVEIANNYPHHKYFDVLLSMDKKENLFDIACASFKAMLKAYHNLPDDQQKNWGAYKQANIPHLARFPHFGADFISTSGGKHIINAMNRTHGPSWRMIVELSSPPKAWVNYPGGQSGDPASPHFHDMLDQFFDGKYYEVSLQKDPAGWTPAKQINITPQ